MNEEVIRTDRTFNPEDIFVTANSPRQEYSQKLATGRSFKWGQLKLLMGEIIFLVNHWNPEEHPEPTLVVAGGASGQHYPALLSLFPGIRLDLWDSAPFGRTVAEDERVTIYPRYFNPEEARNIYRGRRDIIFISDIRSGDPKYGINPNVTKVEADQIIVDDQELQKQILITLDPITALFKFRPYYPDTPGVDRPYRYLNGHIYKQCFNGTSSTETRLVPYKIDGKWAEFTYSAIEFEERLAYYNRVIRDDMKGTYTVWHNHINGLSTVPDTEFVNSHDFFYMTYILDRYLTFAGYEGDPDQRYLAIMSLWHMIKESINSQLVNRFDVDKAVKLSLPKPIPRPSRGRGNNMQQPSRGRGRVLNRSRAPRKPTADRGASLF